MAYNVFIFHSSRDTWVAEQIAFHLQNAGVDSFLDERDIHYGDDFEEKIFEEIRVNSDELLLLLTPWALGRSYIWLEVGAARYKNIKIVTVLHGITVDEIQQDSNIPVLLKKHDIFEINQLPNYFIQIKSRRT